MESSDLNLLIFFGGIALVWLFPILIIIGSNKTMLSEKVAWVLAIIFMSWFAWVFYLLLAPLKPKKSKDLERY